MLVRVSLLVAIVTLSLGIGRATAGDASLPTVVVFDSICLQCHEGECSGRLALRTDNNPAAVADHVKGYAGPQSGSIVAELKALLGRVKTDCALPPPPVASPDDGQWTPALLSPLTVTDRQRMFVPLGTPGVGAQQLVIRATPSQRIRIQVIAQTFDIIVDEDLEIGPDPATRRWTADDAGPHFLRIIAKAPLGDLFIRNQPVR